MNKMLFFKILSLFSFSLLFYNFYTLNTSNNENNYYFTTKENYKFLDEKEELNITYKGNCEHELFNRYSKLKNDDLIINDYVSFLNSKRTFKEVKEKQTSVIDNIEDQNLKKSLKISFNGPDITLLEVSNYNNFCNQTKAKIIFDYMVLNGLFILFLFVFSGKRYK